MSKILQMSPEGCLNLCGIQRKSWVMNTLHLGLQPEYYGEFIVLKNKATSQIQALSCLFFLNDIFVIFFLFCQRK